MGIEIERKYLVKEGAWRERLARGQRNKISAGLLEYGQGKDSACENDQ
jgi:CYTH domain-containing protein